METNHESDDKIKTENREKSEEKGFFFLERNSLTMVGTEVVQDVHCTKVLRGGLRGGLRPRGKSVQASC